MYLAQNSLDLGIRNWELSDGSGIRDTGCAIPEIPSAKTYDPESESIQYPISRITNLVSQRYSASSIQHREPRL